MNKEEYIEQNIKGSIPAFRGAWKKGFNSAIAGLSSRTNPYRPCKNCNTDDKLANISKWHSLWIDGFQAGKQYKKLFGNPNKKKIK